ncbi:MAG: hypothetical protein ACE5HQ_12620 [Gemmatimonadota bacterium]
MLRHGGMVPRGRDRHAASEHRLTTPSALPDPFEGRALKQGAPDEILSHPRQERTRAFLSAVLES